MFSVDQEQTLSLLNESAVQVLQTLQRDDKNTPEGRWMPVMRQSQMVCITNGSAGTSGMVSV